MSAAAAPVVAPAGLDGPARARWADAGHVGVMAVALALWLAGVHGADVTGVHALGLAGGLPPAFDAAVLALLGGFAAAATGRRPAPAWLLAGYVGALVLVLHGTAPLLYDEPRYAWTYKHLAVTDLLAATGHLDRSLDIYNNWPGFFALAAWLQRLSGVPMIDVAGWAQVAFELATAAAVQFALGGLTTDRRRIWLATVLFVLGNWVGNDYFAPQSLAFVLAFAFLGVCLRATAPRAAPSRLALGLDRPAERLGPVPALVAGGGCWAALVVTHQLTPVLVIAAVVALAAVRRVPLWVPVAMVALEGAWVALAWDFLAAHFHLLDARGVTTPDPQAGGRGTPMAAVGWAALGGRVVAGTLVLLAVAGVVATVRRGRLPASALALVLAPCAVVPLQAYGGEGVLRAYVFTLPWLSLLAAGFLLHGAAAPRRTLRAGLALAVLAAGFLLAYFGLEQGNRIAPGDVAVSAWYERHATPGSLAVVAAPNLPMPLTRRYAVLRTMSGDGVTSLTDYPQIAGAPDGAAAVRRVARFAAERRGAPLAVVLSGSERRYARLYGLFRPGFLADVERALRRSPRFRAVYRRGGGSIYQYVGSGRGR